MWFFSNNFSATVGWVKNSHWLMVRPLGCFESFKKLGLGGWFVVKRGLNVLSWSSGNQVHPEVAKERNPWGRGALIYMRCAEQFSHQLALPLLMITLGRRWGLWTLKWIVNYSCILFWMEVTCISGARPRIHYFPVDVCNKNNTEY